MRVVVVVTGGVLSTRHDHLVIRQFLGLVGNDISFAALGNHMPDITFLRFDVIGDLVGLVTVLPVFEDRLAFPFVVQAVVHTACIDGTAVHMHAYVLGLKLHAFVFQVTATVQICRTVVHHNHRVFRLVMNRRFQVILRPQCRRAQQEKDHLYVSTYAYVHYTAN